MKKQKRMAEGLLQSLEQAVAMERGELKGRETVRKFSKPAPQWSKVQIKSFVKKCFI